MKTWNPFWSFGRFGDTKSWGGWVCAVDADTGVWKRRLKSSYPVLSGMTPTAGGVVFFGDVGGNFYALAAPAIRHREAIMENGRRPTRQRETRLQGQHGISGGSSGSPQRSKGDVT